MPDIIDTLRAERDRLRTEARAILTRASAEDRDPTHDELEQADRLYERLVRAGEELAEETADRDRAENHLATITRARVSATTAGPAAAQWRSRSGLAFDREVLGEAVDALNRRQQYRSPLTRALPAGGSITATGYVTWANRIFDMIEMQTNLAYADAGLTVSAQVAGEVVPSGQPKPIVGTIGVTGLTKVKIGGYLEFTWEAATLRPDLESFLTGTLVPALIQAENGAVVTTLDAVAPVVPFTDSAASSLLLGIANVSSWGKAGAIILNPADIVTVVGQSTTQGSYVVATDPTKEVLTLWGVPLFFADDVAAGFGYVIDPTAMTAYTAGPAELITGWVDLRNNLAGAVIDELASVGVNRVAATAKVALTGVAAGTATGTRNRS